MTLDRSSSFQRATIEKKNIQAHPRIVHTEQSTHSLSCPWPLSCPHLSFAFNVVPRVSWMVSSSSRWVADTLKQEETPAMTHNANTESRGAPGWVTSCPFGLPSTWNLITLLGRGLQEKPFVENIMSYSLFLMITYTESDFYTPVKRNHVNLIFLRT